MLLLAFGLSGSQAWPAPYQWFCLHCCINDVSTTWIIVVMTLLGDHTMDVGSFSKVMAELVQYSIMAKMMLGRLL